MNDHPMLAATGVTLQAESSARLDLQTLDLVAGTLFEDFKAPPRSLFTFSHFTIPPP